MRSNCPHHSVFQCASCHRSACLNCGTYRPEHDGVFKTVATECVECFAKGGDWIGEVRDLRAQRYQATKYIGREDHKRVAEIDSAGFYKADMQKLVWALHELVERS